MRRRTNDAQLPEGYDRLSEGVTWCLLWFWCTFDKGITLQLLLSIHRSLRNKRQSRDVIYSKGGDVEINSAFTCRLTHKPMISSADTNVALYSNSLIREQLTENCITRPVYPLMSSSVKNSRIAIQISVCGNLHKCR